MESDNGYDETILKQETNHEGVKELTTNDDHSDVNETIAFDDDMTAMKREFDTKLESDNDYDETILKMDSDHFGVKDFTFEQGTDETVVGTDHNDKRLDAMLKRNARQEQLANKAMKQYAA